MKNIGFRACGTNDLLIINENARLLGLRHTDLDKVDPDGIHVLRVQHTFTDEAGETYYVCPTMIKTVNGDKPQIGVIDVPQDLYERLYTPEDMQADVTNKFRDRIQATARAIESLRVPPEEWGTVTQSARDKFERAIKRCEEALQMLDTELAQAEEEYAKVKDTGFQKTAREMIDIAREQRPFIVEQLNLARSDLQEIDRRLAEK